MTPRTVRVYRLNVEYPPGAFADDFEPEGWIAPPRSADPDAEEPTFRWPAVRLYFSKKGAQARARLLRQFGAVVKIEISHPVRWAERAPGETP